MPTKHVYDLDLKAVFETFSKGIQKVKLEVFHPEHTPKYLSDFLKSRLVDYCNGRDINFDKTPYIVISPELQEYYSYLGLSLVFYPVAKIYSYLSHHKKEYKKKGDKKIHFVNLVEYWVLQIFEYASPFDNSERQKEIMLW